MQHKHANSTASLVHACVTNVNWTPACVGLCAGSKGADFLVVDINYFPGYEKLPNHASMTVGFLKSLLEPEQGQQAVLERHVSSCLDPPGSGSDTE